MDWANSTALDALDQSGYTVLEALTTAPLPGSTTFSRPNAFVCVDGRTYWVKANVQQGLVAELVAGRLAALVGAGPAARVIRVTPECDPGDGSVTHLVGVVVGSEDQPGMVNARDLGPLIAGGQLQAGAIDPASRARVTVFHSWLGMGDAQVLVSLTDGKVMSIDHGDCFGAIQDSADAPTPIVVGVPGVPDDVGKERVFIEQAVRRIEQITDNEIARAVAQVPAGGEWRSPADRRRSIGKWLSERRSLLRGVMVPWSLP